MRCKKVEYAKARAALPKWKNVANNFYLEMLANHKGKDNIISSKAMAVKLSQSMMIDVNEHDVWFAGFKLRTLGKMPGLISTSKGMYVDDSLDGMCKNLRFLATQWKSLHVSIKAAHRSIIDRYGEGAIPEDINQFMEEFYEQDPEIEYYD